MLLKIVSRYETVCLMLFTYTWINTALTRLSSKKEKRVLLFKKTLHFILE